MKKYFYIIPIVLAVFIFAGCTSTQTGTDTSVENKVQVQEQTQTQTQEQTQVQQTTQPQTDTQTSQSTTSKYSMDIVASHNTKDDCWMVIDGQVADVTSFVSKHPGGIIIAQGCGKDASTMFHAVRNHAGGKVQQMLSALIIGSVTN